MERISFDNLQKLKWEGVFIVTKSEYKEDNDMLGKKVSELYETNRND